MTHHTVSIVPVRAAQLRQIAAFWAMPATHLLDEMIRRHWLEIGRAPDLPGFDFAAGRDDVDGSPIVVFAVPGTEPVLLSVPQAREVVQGLRDLIEGAATRFAVTARTSEYRAGLFGERVGRHGFAIRVADNLDRDSKAVRISGLSASVAVDLANTFEAYADKAASDA